MPNQQQHVDTHASHALLPRWANDQDGWSRAIAGDVLKNRVRPSDLDVDRYLRLLLSEKKLSPEPFQAVPKIEEKQLAGNPLDAVRLDSLKVGDGVNALKPGAQIDFAPGVTVIFILAFRISKVGNLVECRDSAIDQSANPLGFVNALG